MRKLKWSVLQLFAEGGAGGDGGSGASSGVTPAAAGQEGGLEAMGVPHNLAEKHRAIKARKAAAVPSREEEHTQTDETGGQTRETGDASRQEENKESRKPTWSEIMADPDYKKEMSKIVQDRLKSSKDAEARLEKLAPMLRTLAEHYGVDANDADAVANAVNGDTQYYESKASELGIPVEMAMHIDQLEQAEAKRQAQDAEAKKVSEFNQHLETLRSQGEELKKTFPNFDLGKELQNDAFRRMTSPGGGVSVADAYYAVHRQEIMAAQNEAVAKRTAQRISKSIQSGLTRPAENGLSGQAAVSPKISYANMTKQEREALKARIRSEGRVPLGG